MKKSDLKKFENSIPEKLKMIASILDKDNLDYTFETIDAVESLYRKMLLDKVNLCVPFNEFELSVYAYIGEAIKYYVGGKWAICNRKQDEAYETPIITDWGRADLDNITISPYIWCELMKLGKMDIKISTLIQKLIRRQSND